MPVNLNPGTFRRLSWSPKPMTSHRINTGRPAVDPPIPTDICAGIEVINGALDMHASPYRRRTRTSLVPPSTMGPWSIRVLLEDAVVIDGTRKIGFQDSDRQALNTRIVDGSKPLPTAPRPRQTV